MSSRIIAWAETWGLGARPSWTLRKTCPLGGQPAGASPRRAQKLRPDRTCCVKELFLGAKVTQTGQRSVRARSWVLALPFAGNPRSARVVIRGGLRDDGPCPARMAMLN
jgi:hypothetical protein